MTNAAGWIDAPPIVEMSIDQIRHLATLPVVALEIMRLAEDPDSTADDVNRVITNDPALTTRILKVVNSTFYGLPRTVASIERGVLLLGLNAVKNVAVAASLHKVFQADEIGGDFDARDLWKHSVAVATGARLIAEKTSLSSSDEAFLAGLIHDVGIIVEMQACRPQFVEVIASLSADDDLNFRQAEEQVLGATHEMFGAVLCRRWRFPVILRSVVGHHHRPLDLPEEERVLPAIVHVADILAARIGAGYTRTVETTQVDPQILSLLNLDEADVEAIAEALPAAIEEAQQLLSN